MHKTMAGCSCATKSINSDRYCGLSGKDRGDVSSRVIGKQHMESKQTTRLLSFAPEFYERCSKFLPHRSNSRSPAAKSRTTSLYPLSGSSAALARREQHAVSSQLILTLSMDTTSLPQPLGPGTPPSSSRSAFALRQASWVSRGSSPFSRPHGLPASVTVGHLAVPGHERRGNASSATWTSSSGDLGDQSDTIDVQDRFHFIEEYNRLAKKVGLSRFSPGSSMDANTGQHGIRLLIPEDYDPSPVCYSLPSFLRCV